MRVLIAEDSRTARRILEDTVTSLGHECLVAAHGAEAWALFQAQGADVIISDWEMPGLDGLEVCRRVRAGGQAAYTYFIFLTSYDDKSHALQGMEAGADDYLGKPLDPIELRLRLIAAARVTRLHRERAAAQRREGRLEGVRLAARTMQHELGNALTRTVGYVQLLARDAGLSPGSQHAATTALAGVEQAVQIVQQLQAVTDLKETDWGPNIPSTITLPRQAP
jgi:DNA-binding response OmpR family regulator